MGMIQGAGLSGMESYALLRSETDRIDSTTCKFLRVVAKGDACQIDGHNYRGMPNEALMKKWRIMPARGELIRRRIKWLQQMMEKPELHRQAIAAIWGHLPEFEGPTVTEEGLLDEGTNPYAKEFYDAVWALEGVSGTDVFSRHGRPRASRGRRCSGVT